MAKITSAGPSHADTAAVPAGLKPDAELLEEHPGYDSQGHATGHPADGTMSPAVSNGEPVRAQPEPGASPAQAAVPPRGPVPAPPREQE